MPYKRELMRAALKVLSAHLDRRRPDPYDINLIRNAVPEGSEMPDAELAHWIIELLLDIDRLEH